MPPNGKGSNRDQTLFLGSTQSGNKTQRGRLCGSPGEIELRALRFPGLEESSYLVGDTELRSYMVPQNKEAFSMVMLLLLS